MTMLSFRVEGGVAAEVGRWAERLGLRRSELLRIALNRYLAQLASEEEAARWKDLDLDDGERSLQQVADWGPAEDWSDWADASR
jgi:hypothetical protein